MTVYVDKLRDWGWRLGLSCHLFADENEELHAFAEKIGLRREWFQKGSLPHYDLTANKRAKAVAAGAVELSDQEAVAFKKRWTAAAMSLVKAEGTEEGKAAVRRHLYR